MRFFGLDFMMAFVTGRKWVGSGAPPEIEQAHQLIGQIASNWSEVEGLWYLIFTCLMPGARRDQIDAIFFLFDSSRTQRVLVMAVADVLYPDDKHKKINPTRHRIGQLNAKTEELAGWRNAAIHGSLLEAYADHTMQQLTPRIAPGSNKKRRNRLAGKDLIVELNRIGDEIEKLVKDLEGFLDTIAPKLEIPRELQKAIDKLGLQGSGSMAIGQNPQTEP
jgi:hypothetical protein